jgi:hypothetical protein
MLGFSAVAQFSLTEYGTATRGSGFITFIDLHGTYEASVSLSARYDGTVDLHGLYRASEDLN